MQRKTLVIAVLVLGVVVAGMALARSGADAVVVTTARVERAASLQSLVTASGEIVAARYADIGANVMGRIVELTVKEGDRVSAGQVLARIDPVQASATAEAAEASLAALEAEARGAGSQVTGARAAVEQAQATATEAAAALARARQLRESGLIAASEFDRTQSTAAAAQASVNSAVAALDRAQQGASAADRRVSQARAERVRARDQLSKTAVTAPIAGTVTRLDVEVGEMVVIGVQNQPGTILMTISDLSGINAEVKVAEADVMRLSTGLPATITLEGVPNQRFTGRVIEIGASALPQLGAQVAAREFRVRVRLDETVAQLKPGLTCDVDIVAAERTQVLTVPLQAVIERDGKTGVLQVTDGRARFVPVTTGIVGGLAIEVTGIAEGAEIIAGPIQALRALDERAPLRIDNDRR
jgi:HlyD family secretion protein